MADSGKFNAKIELKLVNCDSLPPFSETVEFEGLNGTASFKKQVSTADANGVCIDVANDCSKPPRLLVVRPISVQFQIKKKDDWSDATISEWEDLDGSGITRDNLAKVLAFTTSSGDEIALGRSQFYFDGVICLLLGDRCSSDGAKVSTQSDKKTTAEESADSSFTLQFKLNAAPPLYVDSKNRPATVDANAPADRTPVKKLFAVTVQVIAAYGA